MLDKLQDIEARYDRLIQELSDPQVVADTSRFHRLAKEHADRTELVETFRHWKRLGGQIEETRLLLRDSEPELRELAEEEQRSLEECRGRIERDLRRMLLPKDPDDEKDTIVEIRAGTGGEEAALFAGSLLRMYARYAER